MGKMLASLANKNLDKIPFNEARVKDLSTFDSRIERHRQINSNFFHETQIKNKNVVLFNRIETCDTTVCSDFSSLIIHNIQEKVRLQITETEQETTHAFPKNPRMFYLTGPSMSTNVLMQAWLLMVVFGF